MRSGSTSGKKNIWEGMLTFDGYEKTIKNIRLLIYWMFNFVLLPVVTYALLLEEVQEDNLWFKDVVISNQNDSN